MAQSGSKASIWNPRFSSRRRAPFWLEAMRATILRSPQFARDRKHLLRQHLAQTVAALVGRHQQADLAQVPEPAGFAVMQAAIAEQLAILLGEHGGVLAGFDSPKLARQTLRRGQVHHQEEQVVFRLLLDERLKGTAILGGHEAQGDTCAPDPGNPGKGSLGSLAGHESTVAR